MICGYVRRAKALPQLVESDSDRLAHKSLKGFHVLRKPCGVA